MNIVIDTNVVISGTFFGGAPRRVLEAVVDKTLSAYATAEIVEEYAEIVQEMLDRNIDSRSYYIVSGDKDLLVLENYEGIEIITAADFCKRFLSEEDDR